MHPQRHLSPCHISQPHLVTAGTRPEGLHPVHIPPRACPPLGDTHLPPVLEPRDLGGREATGVTLQGQGLPRHARHVGPAPVLPEAGGHLGEGEAEVLPLRRSATARDPIWAVLPGLEGGPDSPPSPASGLPGRPFQTLAVRSRVDLGVATAASPWSSPGTLLAPTFSSPSCGSHWFHPVLHPNGCHGHQGGCLGDHPAPQPWS